MPFDALGALNTAAGTTGLGLNAVCNKLAGTVGLEAVGALNKLNGTTGVEWLGCLRTLDATLIGRTNLCINPSFETNTTSWSTGGAGGGTLTIDAAAAYSGASGLKVACTGSGNSLNLYGNAARTPATAGVSYAFSAYVKSAATPRLVDIVVNWYDSGGTPFNTVSGTQSSSSTSAWTRFTHTATAPATTASCIMQVRIGGVVATEVHYIDGVLIEAAASVGTFFDGSSGGAKWTGTANASTSTLPALGLGIS